MAAVYGIGKTSLLFFILGVFVLIPSFLSKIGVELGFYTEFFTEPFVAFSIIFCVGIFALHKYIRSNIVVAAGTIILIVIGSFIYVYTLLI